MLSKHCIPNNVKKKKIYIYRFYYFRIPLDDATLSFFKNKIDFDNAARGSRVARDRYRVYLTKMNLIKNAELGEGLQTVCLFRVPFISSDYQMTGICKRR